MIEALAIPGAFRLDGVAAGDERGAFRKILDGNTEGVPEEFRDLTEVAISHNTLAGTVRGLHWQADPFGQTKVVFAASGRLVDVLVDVRPESPSYGSWLSVELSAGASTGVLIPTGVAHGFQTLDDATSVVYLMRGGYAPESARTLRFDDDALAIDWPLPVSVISDKDRSGAAWPVS
jgi:dTDP-4-dehydrorhamnose 3,5-epimerase